jgi:hypothetical protein
MNWLVVNEECECRNERMNAMNRLVMNWTVYVSKQMNCNEYINACTTVNLAFFFFCTNWRG